jgi:copper(I)-binding protein
MRKYLWSIALSLVGTPSLAAPPVAHDPWIREPPPNVVTAAAYARIEGAGTADRLIGARTDVCDHVEIHTHVAHNGVMTMTEIDGLAIPVGGGATLAPGGDHLMLIGLRRALKAGETITFTLFFEKSGEVTVPFQVRDARAQAQPQTSSQR